MKLAALLFLTLAVACTARNPLYQVGQAVPGADADEPEPPADAAPPPVFPDAAAPTPDAPTLPPDAAVVPPDLATASPDLAIDLAPTPDLAPADTAPVVNPDVAPPRPDLAPDTSPGQPDTSATQGLTGFYYKDNALTTLAFQRVDPVIDFSWGNETPDPTIPIAFSVRWTGKINLLYTEPYTFSVHSGDGCRLWIDNTLLIDDWKNQSPIEVYAKPTMFTAGWHTIKLEYLHNTGWSAVRILWESTPSQKRGVVSPQNLSPS